MKNGFIIIILVAIISSFSSCSDFLHVDNEIKDRLTIEAIFSNREYVEEYLANSYTYLINDNGDVGIGNWPFAFSDDMYNPQYKNIEEV